MAAQLIAIAAIGGGIGLLGHTPKPTAPLLAPTSASTAPQPDPLAAYCGADLNAHVKAAREAMAKSYYSTANEELSPCADRLPKDSEAYKLFSRANAAHIKRLEATRMASEAATKARKRRNGVTIGMSQQDVLDSSWGKPLHINRTTTARGVHEQWVYGGTNYLYFEDGILSALQN